MTTIKFRDWELFVDKTVTENVYEKVLIGAPESCGCDDCKNFASNRKAIYPDEIKKLFFKLGIDIRKESEICHYCKLDNGLHFYGGWFHFKGRFVGKDCKIPLPSGGSTLDLTPINETFSIGFCYDHSLSFFNDDKDLVQIEFDAKTPWTIDKTLESM